MVIMMIMIVMIIMTTMTVMMMTMMRKVFCNLSLATGAHLESAPHAATRLPTSGDDGDGDNYVLMMVVMVIMTRIVAIGDDDIQRSSSYQFTNK